jgi:hypothetical protein
MNRFVNLLRIIKKEKKEEERESLERESSMRETALNSMRQALLY